MAEDKRGDLTVKITADVDEAVRELESAYKDAEKASKNIETWY